MKIREASIILENTGGIVLENKDIIVESYISGGEIHKGKNIDILFKRCYIRNCEYSIKEFGKTIPSCPVISNCTIKNCKIPHTFYVNCRFTNNKEDVSTNDEGKKWE